MSELELNGLPGSLEDDYATHKRLADLLGRARRQLWTREYRQEHPDYRAGELESDSAPVELGEDEVYLDGTIYDRNAIRADYEANLSQSAENNETRLDENIAAAVIGVEAAGKYGYDDGSIPDTDKVFVENRGGSEQAIEARYATFADLKAFQQAAGFTDQTLGFWMQTLSSTLNRKEIIEGRSEEGTYKARDLTDLLGAGDDVYEFPPEAHLVSVDGNVYELFRLLEEPERGANGGHAINLDTVELLLQSNERPQGYINIGDKRKEFLRAYLEHAKSSVQG